MENSAYGPSHLPSPALVVFSQAAGGLTEALRIQRPFHSQVNDGKDVHLPLGLGLRHMEAAYGAHLLHHLPHQFLHPALDSRAPFGSGAFRPLGPAPGLSLDVKPFPSAFTPPSKCSVNIDSASDSVNIHQANQSRVNHLSNMLFSPNMNLDERFLSNLQSQNISHRTDSSSPASVSLSPPVGAVKEESMEAHLSEEEHSQTPGPPEDLVEHRNKNNEETGFRRVGGLGKKVPPDPASCPVCGVTLGAGELEAHFMQELERLYKLTSGRVRRHDLLRTMGNTQNALDGRWETFQRIKTNRQSRLRIKTRKRKADETTCPVCLGRLQRSPQELSAHVEHCLRKNSSVGAAMGSATDEDEPVDVEGDSEMFEEQPSWNEGQCRIRATTLLVGLANSMATPSSSDQPNEAAECENEDLVVDGDDNDSDNFRSPQTVVPSQYCSGEAEVVPINTISGQAEKRGKLNSEGVQSQEATVNSSGDVELPQGSTQAPSCDSHVTTSDAEPSSRAQVLEELRARIRELEGDAATPGDAADDQYKCLICMEHYKEPMISTLCWHVHCEQCWKRSFETKKVCPQCDALTSSSDLRRINM